METRITKSETISKVINTEKDLSQMNREDAVKDQLIANREIDRLNSKAKTERTRDNTRSTELCKKAIEKARVSGYSKGLGEAYFNMGISCRLSSNFEAAIEYFEEALKINREFGDKHSESRTLNAIGNVYLSLSKFDSAIEYYDESIFVLQSMGDMKFETLVLSNRGLAYQQYGDIRASLNNYLESLSICRSMDIPIHYALMNNIGIVYLEIGSYNEALTYFTEALKRTISANNKMDQSLTLANIGRTYIYLEDPSNAVTYLSEAQILTRDYGNRQVESQIFSNLGKAYLKMRCYPEAMKFFNRALKYYKEISDTSSVSHTLCELGELYYELNDYKTSKEYFTNGLDVSKTINDLVNEVRTNTGLAKLYVRFKDTEKAAIYLSRAEELALSRMSYKELIKITKLHSDNFVAEGKRNEAKQALEQHYEYIKKLNNLEEETKLQSILLGHVSSNDENRELLNKYIKYNEENLMTA